MHTQLTLLNLNSRQAIKKYVKANNKVQFTSETQFDSMFNKALKSGVEKGEFTQPKGMTSEFASPLYSLLRHVTYRLCSMIYSSC
jgi:hypothetical protein